ncbi:methyltransferase FkbM domain containing protein [Nitzschia inconspicua]|uniref:Methyltransferase FkbM domain containing protein n=1 Tax=Nitzschia inconspicua TaxID=303405 RepID=A0A9K3L9G6_9STRA|nr:methyltransferase FkbM domain containing protein [Nitzschia inconspicua]
MKRNRERLSVGHPQVATSFLTGILIGFFASSLLFLSASSPRLLESNYCTDSSPRSGISSTQTKWSIMNAPKSSGLQTGWKKIHVFYGDRTHIYDATSLPTAYFIANTWFSQYRQDELISRLLYGKRNGYFIDLAANDAIRISNTYALETSFGWDGLCIEPNPVYWAGLSYRKCQLVAAIIGNQTMQEIKFRFPKLKAPQGGILGEHFDNKSDRWNEGHPRFTVSLLDVFELFDVPKAIDYISLDVEGAEDLVMSSFPFQSYRFNLMTLERPSATLSNLLISNGYVLLKTIKNVDSLWAHQSILDDLDRTVLDVIDTENYKYRENTRHSRVAPEEK